MTESEFLQLFRVASNDAVDFARGYVVQELATDSKCRVKLNQSYDGNAEPDEVLYPEDDGRAVACDSAEDVVKVLYRDGRCPEWIDVAVEAVGNGFTLLRLECCGRFTNSVEKMYYSNRGSAPFGVKSPKLPRDYTEGSRFQIPNTDWPCK